MATTYELYKLRQGIANGTVDYNRLRPDIQQQLGAPAGGTTDTPDSSDWGKILADRALRSATAGFGGLNDEGSLSWRPGESQIQADTTGEKIASGVGSLAGFLLPMGLAAKPAGLVARAIVPKLVAEGTEEGLKRIATRMAVKEGLTGAAYGTAEGIAAGEDGSGIAKQAALQAALFGAMGGASPLLGKAMSKAPITTALGTTALGGSVGAAMAAPEDQNTTAGIGAGMGLLMALLSKGKNTGALAEALSKPTGDALLTDAEKELTRRGIPTENATSVVPATPTIFTPDKEALLKRLSSLAENMTKQGYIPPEMQTGGGTLDKVISRTILRQPDTNIPPQIPASVAEPIVQSAAEKFAQYVLEAEGSTLKAADRLATELKQQGMPRMAAEAEARAQMGAHISNKLPETAPTVTENIPKAKGKNKGIPLVPKAGANSEASATELFFKEAYAEAVAKGEANPMQYALEALKNRQLAKGFAKEEAAVIANRESQKFTKTAPTSTDVKATTTEQVKQPVQVADDMDKVFDDLVTKHTLNNASDPLGAATDEFANTFFNNGASQQEVIAALQRQYDRLKAAVNDTATKGKGASKGNKKKLTPEEQAQQNREKALKRQQSNTKKYKDTLYEIELLNTVDKDTLTNAIKHRPAEQQAAIMKLHRIAELHKQVATEEYAAGTDGSVKYATKRLNEVKAINEKLANIIKNKGKLTQDELIDLLNTYNIDRSKTKVGALLKAEGGAPKAKLRLGGEKPKLKTASKPKVTTKEPIKEKTPVQKANEKEMHKVASSIRTKLASGISIKELQGMFIRLGKHALKVEGVGAEKIPNKKLYILGRTKYDMLNSSTSKNVKVSQQELNKKWDTAVADARNINKEARAKKNPVKIPENKEVVIPTTEVAKIEPDVPKTPDVVKTEEPIKVDEVKPPVPKAKRAPRKPKLVAPDAEPELNSEGGKLPQVLLDLFKDEGGFIRLPGGGKNIREALANEEAKRTTRLLQSLKSKKFKLFSGVDVPGGLKDLEDVVVIGAIKIARKGLQFADWSAEMLKDLGDKVKPHLDEIWSRSNAYLRQNFSKRQLEGKPNEGPVPMFYSQLRAAINNSKQESMHAQSVINVLKKEGVPAEELRWTGFTDWLAAKKGAKVSKQEMLDYLDTNDIHIQEISRKDTSYTAYTLPGSEDTKSRLFILSKAGTNNAAKIKPYQSEHWEKENVLAHVRVNDRVGKNGEKILHIEEVQSDWHRDMVKRGALTEKQIVDIRTKIDQLEKEKRTFLGRIGAPKTSSGEFAIGADSSQQQMINLLDRMSAQLNQLQRDTDVSLLLADKNSAEAIELARINTAIKALKHTLDAKVPEAPLVESEWIPFVMKRMLRYAAEHDYDRITWTIGKQQGKRYNQMVEADHIAYNPETKMFEARKGGANGDVVFGEVINDEVALAGLVGKENATKLLEEGKKADVIKQQLTDARIARSRTDDTTKQKQLQNKITELQQTLRKMGVVFTDETYELNVPTITLGGKHLTEQYDKTMVNFMNKYGKRWGIKVEPGEIQLDTALFISKDAIYDISKIVGLKGHNYIRQVLLEDNISQDSNVLRVLWGMNRQQIIAVLQKATSFIDNAQMRVRFDNAIEAAQNYTDKDALEHITVHSVSVTKAMKNSVLYEGQPMFTSPSTRPLDVIKDNPKFKKLWEVLSDNKGFFKLPDAVGKQAERLFKAKNTRSTFANGVHEIDGVNKSLPKELDAKIPRVPKEKVKEIAPMLDKYKEALVQHSNDYEKANADMAASFGEEKAQWVRDGYVGESLERIDASAGSLNEKLDRLIGGRTLKDLTDDELKTYIRTAKALAKVDAERDLLRPEIDRLTGGTATQQTKAIIDRIENSEIVPEGLVRSYHNGKATGGDEYMPELNHLMSKELKLDKPIYLQDARHFTTDDIALMHKPVGIFEHYFGVMRDVLPEPVADTLRKASTVYNHFARQYEKQLFDIVKPIVNSPESRKVVYYLLEGKNVQATDIEKNVAKQLREKIYDPLFKSFGINNFVTDYAPRIHQQGIWNEIATKGTMTSARKAEFFAELERKGILVPTEKDAITTALAYIRQGGKARFVQPAFDAIDKRIVGKMAPSRAAVYAKLQDNVLNRPVWEQRLINTTINKLGTALCKELGLSPTTKLDDYTTVMTRLIYTGTIAYNPMTALKNFTQMTLAIGTLDGNIKNGVKYFGRAARALRTEEGQKLLKYNWVGQSRQYLEGQDFQSTFLNKLLTTFEKGDLGAIPGVPKGVKLDPFGMLKYSDKVNVNMSYMMKLLHAMDSNKSLAEAVAAANKFAGDTQFLYGLDSPLLYKTSVGRLVGVLMSWPINFARLMRKTLKDDPSGKAKVAYVLGGMAGLQYILNKTGLDFSSTSPVAVAQGWLPIAMATSEAGSIPVQTVTNSAEAISALLKGDPRVFDEAKTALGKNLSTYIPYSVQGKRLLKFYKASMNDWTVENTKGQKSYTMTPREAYTGLIGGTTANKERSREFARKDRADYEYRKLREKAIQAYMNKDKESFTKYQKELAKKYNRNITNADIKRAIANKNKTALERFSQGTPNEADTGKTAGDYAKEFAGL